MRAYRLLTAEDTSAFCHKVTEALAKGWELYGSPAYAFDAASGTSCCLEINPRFPAWCYMSAGAGHNLPR